MGKRCVCSYDPRNGGDGKRRFVFDLTTVGIALGATAGTGGDIIGTTQYIEPTGTFSFDYWIRLDGTPAFGSMGSRTAYRRHRVATEPALTTRCPITPDQGFGTYLGVVTSGAGTSIHNESHVHRYWLYYVGRLDELNAPYHPVTCDRLQRTGATPALRILADGVHPGARHGSTWEPLR